MNLHGFVRGAVSYVNPDIPAVIRQGDGYTTGVDGCRTPTFKPDIDVIVQKQDLSQRELMQIDKINQQGITCSIYLNGNYYGVRRGEEASGDLVFMSGQKWKVIQVLESWPDWCKLALSLQQT